jgi:hypothetical protein
LKLATTACVQCRSLHGVECRHNAHRIAVSDAGCNDTPVPRGDPAAARVYRVRLPGINIGRHESGAEARCCCLDECARWCGIVAPERAENRHSELERRILMARHESEASFSGFSLSPARTKDVPAFDRGAFGLYALSADPRGGALAMQGVWHHGYRSAAYAGWKTEA